MTSSALVQQSPPLGAQEGEYIPGVCNIGPQEIARRRRSGHLAAIITIGLFVVLVALDVPPAVRFLVALPAAGAAVSYLQAFLRFCAGFASRGVFNFGLLGPTTRVESETDRARDVARARQIFAASIAIGVVVGLLAVLLPL